MGQIKNIKLHIVTDIKSVQIQLTAMAGLVRTSLLRNLSAVRTFATSTTHRSLEQAPIKVLGVEGRYAHALFSAAARTGELESAEQELNAVQALLNDEAALSEYCNDPTINKYEKRDVVVDVLKASNFSDLTVNFMSVVAEENRLRRSSGIIKAFNTIMRARRGEVDCKITSAKPLDAAALEQLRSTLQKFVKPTETLVIETDTDPAVIGGVVVNLGEYYIDMSTATKVKRISAALKGETN